MNKAFFFLLSCGQEEKEPVQNPKPTVIVEEVVHEKESSTTLPAQKYEPLVYSPINPNDPISLTIDVRQINIEIANSFLSEEVQNALLNPLQSILSGKILLEISAPSKPGERRPLIALRISRDQFLSLVSVESGMIKTQRLVDVFRALNSYRSHAGNYSDLRIFHFWIALDVEECRIFPKHQDAFTPIVEIDECVEIEGKQICGTIEGSTFVNFPQLCIKLSP